MKEETLSHLLNRSDIHGVRGMFEGANSLKITLYYNQVETARVQIRMLYEFGYPDQDTVAIDRVTYDVNGDRDTELWAMETNRRIGYATEGLYTTFRIEDNIYDKHYDVPK